MPEPVMRIAVEANSLEAPWGGIPKYLTRIGEGLVVGGDRLDLLANTRHLLHPVPGAHEVGIRVKGTPIWRNGFVPLWLATRRPDVFWSPVGMLPRWTPVPSVSTIHDLAMLRYPGSKPAALEQQFRGEISRSANQATRIITVSEATADDVVEYFGVSREKIRVVPNGVDEQFVPGDRDAARAAVERRWGITTPFVLHVGSLEPRKGLDVLIEAAGLAAAAGAGWRLALAGGTGYLGEAIEAAARSCGTCDLLGMVEEDELLQLYRAAAAFAAPAIYEGFGIAPLEAMACETPVVIAGGSGGLEETSASASIVVAERRATDWVTALDQAIGRPPEMIERGRALAARFRWPQIAAETRAVLGEAQKAGTGRPGRRL